MNPEALLTLLKMGQRYGDHPELGGLGRVFEESSHLNPDYFAAPGRVPEADAAKLGAKHGVSVDPMDVGNGESAGMRFTTPGGTSAYVTEDAPVGIMKDIARRHGEVADYRKWADSTKRGALSDSTRIFGIDMMGAGQGTGDAKALYAPSFEWLLAQDDAANAATTGLSANNMGRKGLSMTGALEKFGDRAGNRLLIDNSQLTGAVAGPSRELEYSQLPTSSKIGLLNLSAAPTTVRRVNDSLGHITRAGHQGANVEKLMAEMRRLGLSDKPWVPSTDVDEQFFNRLAGLLRDAPGGQKVGVDSLRRAAIVQDHLQHGLTARDLASQKYLTRHLARKDGGSVQTPGALTQTCSCAKK